MCQMGVGTKGSRNQMPRTSCCFLFPLFPSHGAQCTVLLERGLLFTKPVLSWISPKADGSWLCLSPRDASRSSTLLCSVAPKTATKSMSFSTPDTCLCPFSAEKLVRGISLRTRLAQGSSVLEPCLQHPCFPSHR